MDLKRIFHFCVQALNQVMQVQPPINEQHLAVVKHLLAISESVLCWGFISANYILFFYI